MVRKLVLVLLLFSFKATQSPVQFTVPEITVPTDSFIELPVTINTNGNVVGSLEFALNYDQSILQFTDITISNKAQEWLTYTMETGQGTIRWGGYDSSFGDFNLIQPTELFVVTFDVLDFNWTQTPITIGRKTAGTELGWDIPVASTDGYINVTTSTYYTNNSILGTAYPVPTNGKITLDLTIPSPDKYTIRVVDLNGRTVSETTKTFFQGFNSIQQNLYELPEGVYLLQVYNTRFVKSFKIIKNG